MERDLRNKVVVITGGAEGIGYEIAERFLQKQAKVVILLDINEKKGPEAARTLSSQFGKDKAVFYKCDVITDLEQVTKKIYDTFSYVDVLVNNAGILNDKLIKKTIDINVSAVIEWSIKYWEHMRRDKGGHGGTIINLASIYGYRVDQFLPTYQASKFAVMGFTRSLGHSFNYNRSGVRVISINPGFTETALTERPLVWDDTLIPEFEKFLNSNAWQKVKVVGDAAAEAFAKGESGSSWLIEGARPITQVVVSANS